jgi:hypothetical protein
MFGFTETEEPLQTVPEELADQRETGDAADQKLEQEAAGIRVEVRMRRAHHPEHPNETPEDNE